MKFLQTGDWHLGKLFHERPLIDDQRFFLSQVTAALTNARNSGAPYDALIVPGDIYDRAIPGGDAVTLLSVFLTETRRSFPALHLFLLSGNHDSADRLSFLSPLLEFENIHICTDATQCAEPIIAGSGDDAAAVYQIPFLTPGALSVPAEVGTDRLQNTAPHPASSTASDGQPDLFAEQERAAEKTDRAVPSLLRTQQELTAEACRRIAAAHRSGPYAAYPAVVCAHLFARGGKVSDSERTCIGTAEQVDTALFAPFDYTALGHLHSVQQADTGGRIWYSGSPLAYSFDDTPETFMLSVTVKKSDSGNTADAHQSVCSVTKIPISPLHRIVRLEGPYSKFFGPEADSSLIKKNKDCYVGIVCTDTLPHENALIQLSSSFPLIMSFTRKKIVNGISTEDTEKKARVMQAHDPEAIFDLFIENMYGSAFPDATLIAEERKLFLKHAASFTWEAD